MRMIVIKRGRVTFYIKDENIVVSNGDFQYSSYSVYALQNRQPFKEFKETILNSEPPRFSSITEVVALSSQCEIYGESARKPNLEGVECEYRP